jgi:FAD:protein FMN transferase
VSEPRKITRREALRITAVGGAALALGGVLTGEVLRRAGLHRVTDTRPRLGTLVTITAVHVDAGAARDMVRAAFAEIERLEGILSRHASGTPMARLNASGALEDAPHELIEVLGRAREIHGLSGGAFDPTVLPLLRLFERGAERGTLPTDADVARALELVGLDAVEMGPGSVRLTRPGSALTLDGIAKGYVVDRAVAVLAATDAERVMVDAGGDIASGGVGVAGEPWSIAIQHPDDPARPVGRVRLAGQAVATSGDYMQAFTQDRRHHHILDPRNGRSPTHTSSVTVVAGTAMDADALSTALLVLGPEAGLDLLDRVPGAEGMLVGKDGTLHASEGFAI